MSTNDRDAKVPTILIADDDPAIVRALADRCSLMGFKVATASNGIQALILARRDSPDVLIVDVNMPEIDGLSLCSRLLDPRLKSVEVIVMTGSRDPDTVERCDSLGAFYGFKGPDFWQCIAMALMKIAPGRTNQIREVSGSVPGPDVKTRPRILIVDDDPDINLFLSSRLGKCGIDTLYAPDGVRGHQIACREEPTIIVSDYYMPNGDAHYLLWKLRGTPKTENIPVIVTSGRRLGPTIEQSVMREVLGRPGALRVFTKSFDTNELFAAIAKFCAFESKFLPPIN